MKASAAVTVRAVCLGLLALVLFTIAVAFGRAVVEGRRAMSWALAAEATGDWESAVLHYRHALQWHAPVLGVGDEAFTALVRVGDARAELNDTEGALVAWRSARMSVMATRHYSTPLADELPSLHRRIAAQMAAQSVHGRGLDEATAVEAAREAEARFLAQLDAYESRRPNPLLGALASGAFFGWLLALVGMAARGVASDGTIRRASLLRWTSASIALLVLWLVLVRLA